MHAVYLVVTMLFGSVVFATLISEVNFLGQFAHLHVFDNPVVPQHECLNVPIKYYRQSSIDRILPSTGTRHAAAVSTQGTR